jgi:2'-5' RNA ligase
MVRRIDAGGDRDSRNHLLANPNAATARVIEQPPTAPPSPTSRSTSRTSAPSPIEAKGVFGGALEQHGKDYAAGKVPAGDMSTKPAENVNSNVNFAPLPSELPPTVEATDVAIEQNAARYNASTDPVERRAILKLHDILEEHRAALAPPEKEETKHDYASTQLDLPEETASAIKQLGESIPDEHLADDGREDKPHVTVKYGLHGDDPEAVRALLADEPPITVKLGKTSFFPNGESDAGDVVKVDVESPALRRLNKKIADALPHTDTHPTYKPHATVAYLKPGLGKKYSGNESLVGHTVTLDRITFSDKKRQQDGDPAGRQTPKAEERQRPVHRRSVSRNWQGRAVRPRAGSADSTRPTRKSQLSTASPSAKLSSSISRCARKTGWRRRRI